MKVWKIDSKTQNIEEKDMTMQANSIYSFFNSILIDELAGMKDHIIYSDANALSNKERAFFIGEQLVIGDALIIGQNGLEECDVTIPKIDLEALINHEVNAFYTEVLEILSSSDVNLYRTFEVENGNEKLGLNIEWVLYTFNIADDRTKEYFIDGLKKVKDSTKNIESYIQKMAQLAINSAE